MACSFDCRGDGRRGVAYEAKGGRKLRIFASEKQIVSSTGFSSYTLLWQSCYPSPSVSAGDTRAAR